jgi:CelD/BcsL family acetyltransferase involved in cellulose biosynthesis/GNAT superfamily N-acetyltransferase
MDALVVPQNVAVEAGADAPVRVESRALTTMASLDEALEQGLQEQWRQVVDNDPLASLFQTPGWCLPWYRCYAASYHPYVIVVTAHERVVGLVPMAVDRQTRALVFASPNLADYQDIVALPGYREQVVGELVRHYVDGAFSGVLPIGWLDPASDTPALIQKICAGRGLHCTVRHQPCWRWFPVEGENLAKKFSRVKTHLNHFKRQGEVTFELVTDPAAWPAFRDDFFPQHSLRQLQASRLASFDDPRKQRLYDILVESPDVPTHVTACRVNGRMISGHVGLVWRDVLMLGAPSISLEDEQRSPAVILMAWIIQHAQSLGLKGFDMTIGDSEFKKRLGNQCVQLTRLEVHASRRRYYAQAARDRVVNAAKAGIERVAGENAWQTKVKPAAAWLAYKRERVAEMGSVAAIRTGVRDLRAKVYDRRTGLVYAMTADQLRPVQPKLAAGDTCEIHDDRVEDLLLWAGDSPSTASLLTQCARSYSRVRSSGRTLHTIVVNGKLAGWGYSYLPTEPASLTETPGATLDFGAGAVSLYDFHVLPEWRGHRLYEALLTDILHKRFAAGVTRAFIAVLESNASSRVAIERVGFLVVRRNLYQRIWKQERLVSSPAS